MEVDVAEHIPKTFIGDPVRLNQILFNLLENAFRNTKEGTVSLKIDSENLDGNMALVRFEIADSGEGIPKEVLDQVFDAYYQLKLNQEKIAKDVYKVSMVFRALSGSEEH